MIGSLFALSGAAVGVAHAGLIGRAARGAAGPLSLLVRLGLVAAVLVLAVKAGHVTAGAAGWFSGFALAGAIVHRRLR